MQMACKFQRAFDKNLEFLQISLILLKVFFVLGNKVLTHYLGCLLTHVMIY